MQNGGQHCAASARFELDDVAVLGALQRVELGGVFARFAHEEAIAEIHVREDGLADFLRRKLRPDKPYAPMGLLIVGVQQCNCLSNLAITGVAGIEVASYDVSPHDDNLDF
jgi:hypothetical protein